MTSQDRRTRPAADILVVDDEVGSRRLLTEILSREGYKVRPANGPRAALESALAYPPSLILLDVRMPEMDGFEVCRRLKQDERTCDVPVIFVSALQDVEDRVQGFEAGGVDFVSKPLQESEVLARVETHLRLRSMQLHLEELVAERTAELVQANEALRESEERYRSVVQDTPVMLCAFQDFSKIEFANQAYCDYFGYQIEDLVGSSFLPLIPKEDREGTKAAIAALTPEKPVQSHEHRAIALDGQIRWQRWTNRAIFDEKGQVITYQAFGEDITERKRAEEALIETEEKFRTLVEQSPLSMQISNPDGSINEVNPAFMELWGVSQDTLEQILGEYNVLEDEQVRELGVMPLMERAYEGEEVIIPPILYDPLETFDRLGFDEPSGRTRWVQSHLYPIKDNDGKILHIIHIEEDVTERKEAEQAIRESEKRYRNLVEQAQDGIVVLQEGTIRFANSYIAELSGHMVEELLDTPFATYLTADERSRIADIYGRRMKGDETLPSIYESVIQHKDGSRVDVEFNAGLTTYDGKPADLTIVRDIRERVKAREELEESQRLLNLVMDSVPALVSYVDRRERVRFVNERYEKAYGLSLAQLAGKHIQEILGPDGYAAAKPHIAATLAGETVSFEDVFHYPDTGPRWLSIDYVPDRDHVGDVQGFVGMIRDITKQKHAEEELKKGKERLEEAQRIAQIGDWEYDLRAGEITWSDEMYRIFGLDPQEYVPGARAEEEFYHPKDLRTLRRAFEDLFAAGTDLDVEYRIVTRRGKVKACRSRGKLVLDEQGIPSHARGTTEDITERKLTEQQIIEYQQRLQALASQLTLSEEQERQRIARELHDEVGQTLAFARTGLASARKATSDARREDILDDVSQALRQAIRDTRDLIFDLSSPVLHELGLGPALAEWLEEQVGKKHDLQTDFIHDGRHFALSDDMRTLLYRCTRELLANVVKHAQARRVTVRLEGDETLVRIVVQDDGIGFDADAIPKAAERGAGFGLFSIRERMADLNGSLEMQSEPGQGCRVVLAAPTLTNQASRE